MPGEGVGTLIEIWRGENRDFCPLVTEKEIRFPIHLGECGKKGKKKGGASLG